MARVAKRHVVRLLVVGIAIVLGAAIGVGGVYVYKQRRDTAQKKSEHAPFPTGTPKKLNDQQRYASDIATAVQAKDYTKALGTADDWIRHAKDDSDKAQAYASKASICNTKGDKKCAADSYAAASDIKTSEFNFAYSAGYFYQVLGDKTNALKYYRRALPVASSTQGEGQTPKQDVEAKLKELQ